MATPASKAKSRRKLALGIVAIAIIAVAATPIALARSFNVPLAITTFEERTGTSGTGALITTFRIVTAWEYYFSIRTQAMVRTSSSNASTSGGTTNITIALKLTNPSNQTIDLGSTSVSGGIGGRTHTIYLSVDQGVRANGNYRLDLTFTANVVLFGGVVEAQFQRTLQSNFAISGQ
jgi:hypothetical protein